MNISLKSAVAAILLAGAFGVSSQAQAAVLLDGFGDNILTGTTVTDQVGGASTSNSPGEVISDTLLTSPTRVITADALVVNQNGGNETVVSNRSGTDGVLEINNTPFSNGIVSISYDFTSDPENFNAAGNAFALDVLQIDLTTSVEIIVNNVLTSGYQTFTPGSGNFYALFSNFTGGPQSVFDNVTSIQLNLKGVAGWDAAFDNFRIDTPPPPPPPSNTPEPAVMALMGLGLAGFAAARRKKQA